MILSKDDLAYLNDSMVETTMQALVSDKSMVGFSGAKDAGTLGSNAYKGGVIDMQTSPWPSVIG